MFVCFKMGCVLLKLYFCMLMRLVCLGWGCVKGVLCLWDWFVSLMGFGFMILIYFGYFVLLMCSVMGLLRLWLCCMLLEIVSLFCLNFMCELWL